MAKQPVLVTGGMGGLGEAISVKLYDAGYTVAVTHSPNNTGAETWLARMAGRQFHAYVVDVGDDDSCRQCAQQIKNEVAPNRHSDQQRGHYARCELQETGQGQLGRGGPDQSRFSVQHDETGVCEDMVERGWGRIINVSSIIASKGGFGQTNYAAAKAGMHGFTKSLALEVAKKGVTVNKFSHGFIATKMVTAAPQDVLDTKIIPQIPVGRLGQPEEVAALVVYLCSREAALVTGANFAINGGQHPQ